MKYVPHLRNWPISRGVLVQDNGKHWQLVILAHSMGNRPTTFALGKVYKDAKGKAALQRNTADLPMLVRLYVVLCARHINCTLAVHAAASALTNYLDFLGQLVMRALLSQIHIVWVTYGWH